MSNISPLNEKITMPVYTVYVKNLPEKLKDDIFNLAHYLSLLYGSCQLQLDDESSPEAAKAMDDLNCLIKQAGKYEVMEHREMMVRHHPESK